MAIEITILVSGKPTPEQIGKIVDGAEAIAAHDDLNVTTCLLDKGEVLHVSGS